MILILSGNKSYTIQEKNWWNFCESSKVAEKIHVELDLEVRNLDLKN